MSKSTKKWSEIRKIKDLSSQQFKAVQVEIRTVGTNLDELMQFIGGNARTRDQLIDLRGRTNKPTRLSTALEKKLPKILQFLHLTDDRYNHFSNRVYLAPEKKSNPIPYVGCGGTSRIERYSGHEIDCLTPKEGIHPSCLEGLTLWAAMTARSKPENEKYPEVCPECEHGFKRLATQFNGVLGEQLNRKQFLQLLQSIAVVSKLSA